jgi:hypothetical protein
MQISPIWTPLPARLVSYREGRQDLIGSSCIFLGFSFWDSILCCPIDGASDKHLLYSMKIPISFCTGVSVYGFIFNFSVVVLGFHMHYYDLYCILYLPITSHKRNLIPSSYTNGWSYDITLLLLLLLVGSAWYCGHYWPILTTPDDKWWWLWSNWV